MARKNKASILGIYASAVMTDPLAREEAHLRLAGMYHNDPLKICYASECASKGVLYYNDSDCGEVPKANVVRADFAAWLVLHKTRPDEKSLKLFPEQDWRLMERLAKLEDTTLALMALEARVSPQPPQSAQGEPDFLMMLARHASNSAMADALAIMPPKVRQASVTYTDRNGRNAVHEATHNPNVGVISALSAGGADVDLVWVTPLSRVGKRAAHMAVLAGNPGVAAELGDLAPHQFSPSPSCPQTPYEMGLARLEKQLSEIPRLVPLTIAYSNARNPHQLIKPHPAYVQDTEEFEARQRLLKRIEKATDIAAGFLGVPPPFGHEDAMQAALKVAGQKPGHRLN